MKTSSFDRLAKATDTRGFIVFCVLLRLAMAGLLLYAAWSKLSAQGWSASVYLQHASGPFAMWFQSMAGNVFVDHLVSYGELLIGLSFLFGAFVRPAAFFSLILMMLFYVSAFVTNTAHGLISEHIVYALVSGLFLFGEFGQWYGLDYWMAKTTFVQARPWLLRLF